MSKAALTARPRSEVRRRQRMVGVRLTEAEYATVQHGAQVCGLSIPDFLRRTALPGGEKYLRMAATDERGDQ